MSETKCMNPSCDNSLSTEQVERGGKYCSQKCSTAVTAATRKAESRRSERVPLGVPRSKLSAPKRPGYVRRWINDTGGRIQAAQEGGYQFVEDENMRPGDPDVSNFRGIPGKAVVKNVGTAETGGPQRAYLMEIKKEFYDEDQAKKQKEIDEKEKAFRRGEDSGGQVGLDGRYIPSTGIKIEHETT